MRSKLLPLALVMALVSACQNGLFQGGSSFGGPSGSGDITSYRTGYGVRSGATGSVADSQFGWGH